MTPKYFPLRWESTGDQWWFASPIDWAAANGHYELVRELIQSDGNLLLKLTSLARLRRLETVWDDGSGGGVARCRSKVARRLLRECETLRGHNSLIRAGYGGWLVYTAAAAGDLDFVKELLGRDPLLVFGEGEYGVTDILYAAARGGSGEVFRVVLDCCLSAAERRGEVSQEEFRWEVMNRAVHALARGCNLGVLMELLGDGCDVLAYRDSQGSTVLHTAAGEGHIEIVKHLTSSYDIITSLDDRGNTALHVAAYHGRRLVLDFLISAASPSLISSTNKDGDTFLHSVVSGFRAPNFRRLDRHMDLMKNLLPKIEDVINVQNKDGRTPLHMAIIESIPSEMVELMMSVRYIDLNARDCEGNTPLDLLYGQTNMPSASVVCPETNSRESLVCRMGLQGMGSSPGTCFKIPDAKIAPAGDTLRSSCVEFGSIDGVENGFSNEIEVISSPSRSVPSKHERSRSMGDGKGRLGNLLHWLGRRKEKGSGNGSDFGEVGSSARNSPVSLRQQFSRGNHKRSGAHDVRQVLPKSNLGSPRSAFSESPNELNKSPNVDDRVGPMRSPILGDVKVKRKHGSFNLSLMNNYFCLGSRSLEIEKSQSQSQPLPYSLEEDEESVVVK